MTNPKPEINFERKGNDYFIKLGPARAVAPVDWHKAPNEETLQTVMLGALCEKSEKQEQMIERQSEAIARLNRELAEHG